jgi:hypothetical protein
LQHIGGNGSARAELVTSALRLSQFTIAWSGMVGALALVVSVLDNSPALAGFALNALLAKPLIAIFGPCR